MRLPLLSGYQYVGADLDQGFATFSGPQASNSCSTGLPLLSTQGCCAGGVSSVLLVHSRLSAVPAHLRHREYIFPHSCSFLKRRLLSLSLLSQVYVWGWSQGVVFCSSCSVSGRTWAPRSQDFKHSLSPFFDSQTHLLFAVGIGQEFPAPLPAVRDLYLELIYGLRHRAFSSSPGHSFYQP